MRVGIDYSPAVSHPPGVGRYVRELVRALVRLEERPDLALFDVTRAHRGVDERALGLTIGDPRVKRVRRDLPRSLVRFVHTVSRFGADDWLGRVDVFHHARLVPQALPIHRARQSFALSELPILGSEADAALQRALVRMERVFVFSQAYRSLVLQRYRLDPARVVHTRVGCEHWRRTLATLPVRSGPPRILVLGAVRTSRRPLAILRAFERLSERGFDARLEFAAPPLATESNADPAAAQLAAALSRSPVADKVSWAVRARGTNAHDDLFALERALPERVASAAVLVHLSSDEGTPVTPLEALSVGVPVVASRIGAFEEALAGVAQLVDDDECVREPEVLCAAIRRAIETRDDGQAAARRELVAREFTWERCARETLAAWSVPST